jgi:hypothetical protein
LSRTALQSSVFAHVRIRKGLRLFGEHAKWRDLQVKPFAIFLVCLIGIAIGVLWIGYSACQEAPSPGSETLETAAQRGSSCTSVSGAFRVGLAALWSFTHDSHDEIIAIGIVFIAVFTVVIGLFTADLAAAANKTAQEVKSISEQQLRAYMGTRGGRVILKQIGPQTFLEGHVSLKNFGKTPAFDHRSWVRIDVKEPARSPFDLPGNGFGGTVVSPEAEANLPVRWPVSGEDVDGIRKEAKRIFVWGGADYIDAFGKARFLKFYMWNAAEAVDADSWPLIASDKPDEAN